ncbi:hypothetical protein [Streptomyces sp. SID3343]|uniref:hypothetical protein n=1 Tax=Streptomyces sp. SID3343 TaxID=2690260 RepID=UPI0013C08D26|nr:hypothetical protein [Streptomyces sp. SID3343]MYW06356.1 hypothetical protein [Streptomyces sp. SID3343]
MPTLHAYLLVFVIAAVASVLALIVTLFLPGESGGRRGTVGHAPERGRTAPARGSDAARP